MTFTDVAGTTFVLAEHIPIQAGSAPGDFSAPVDIPTSTQEGTYNVSGTSSVVQLVVAPTGGGSSAREPNRALMAAGGGLLVIGAAGSWMLRRRADGACWPGRTDAGAG